MATAIAKNERDLSKGPIFKNLIIFAIPLIITNIMQLLFNATDIAVLKFMVDEKAVASVGSTSSLTHLIINVFIGLSVGASVVLSRCVGMGDINKARKVVGTAISLSLIGGATLMLVGFFGARTFLTLMDCPDTLIDGATKYLQIYFLGAPIILFYNFSAGMLRAVGDTLRPMIFLMIAGVANVGLNIFFVVVCGLTVEGVAIGTVAAQGISSVLAFITMRKTEGYSKFSFKHLKVYKSEFIDIVKIGVPSAIQSMMFSISNVLIQSTVNSFGDFAVAGNTAASQVDAFVYTSGNSIAHASMSFASQNYGARRIDRIKKGILVSFATIFVVQFGVGLLAFIFVKPLTSIFADSQQALAYSEQRITVMGLFYFMCGMMEVLTYNMRALGKSTTSMVISIFFVCIMRIIWLKTFFLLNPTYAMIFYSYPISWVLCIIVTLFFLVPLIKKLERKKEVKSF